MSTLKSVVGDYHFPRWDAEKLDSDDALARFHENFCGVSMNEGASNSEENDEEQDDAGANEEEGEGKEEEYDDEGQYEGGDSTDEDGEEEEGVFDSECKILVLLYNFMHRLRVLQWPVRH